MAILEDIDVFVKSRYPLIYIVSFEEERVITALSRLAEASKKEVFIWSATQGIYSLSRNAVIKGTENPVKALEQIIEYKEKAFFILKDFHYYMEDPFQQYLENPVSARRKLRDTVLALRGSFKTLFILSPVLHIPRELEKDIVIIDFPLPCYDEIKVILERTLSNVEKHYNLKFNISDDLKEKIVKACLGMTASEVENVFAKAIVNDRCFDEKDLGLIISEKKQIIRKAGMLEYFEVFDDFSNVGGLGRLKEWLTKRAGAFSQKARDYGLPEPKGLLLLGVQGCGKSLVSKCIASLWKLPLLRFDVGNIFGKYVGESEENLRKALRVAEALSPTILWMDEIEKAFAGVGGGGGDSGLSTRIFGSFITWLQEKTAPVFVIATANSIESLPPELLRKGRFDEIFFVDLPSEAERAAIFNIHITRRKRDISKFKMPELLMQSEGFSGAEIEQAIVSSMYDAFYENRDIETIDIEKALKETVPLSQTMKERIDHLREWAKLRARSAS
ncbi:MAG TPA: AAA family ATPase [Candidatus Wallbacteria bacterium]|mgnify:CR=1 FL=1|nr:AAA family ATPase [Candidatus Wallbacteria bacterium]